MKSQESTYIYPWLKFQEKTSLKSNKRKEEKSKKYTLLQLI